MFSGLVEEVGQVLQVRDTAEGRWITIAAVAVTKDVQAGDSISVSGTCLTVVEFERERSFTVEAINETLRRTTIGQLKVGHKINLERSLRLSDRLGGHLVSGHIDAVGLVEHIERDGFSNVVTVGVESDLAPYFVEKGSVAVDGVSLTVIDYLPKQIASDTARLRFRVALIPHTIEATTFIDLKVGDHVNIETDIVARYVARWMSPIISENLNKVHASHPFSGE